jgi:hypothetical protein
LEQFTNLTKKSIQQHISDLITERLKTALTKEDEETKKQEAVQALEQAKLDEVKVVTTEEELEGFMIVKTILRQKISATRITHRDAQSYFAILLDDNNRKTICRLYLNGRFSVPQTHLWLIRVCFSASTFVVKIATFAKPENVVATQKKDNAISTEKIVMENVATQTVIVLQTIQILLFHS